MFLVGDMVAYTGIPNRSSETYRKTHEIIFQHIRELLDKVPLHAPLVILSSSLGTSLITDYIWDRQQGYDPVMGNTPFETYRKELELWKFDTFSKFRGIDHFITTRHGGYSNVPFGRFNLSLNSGEDQTLVAINRTLLAEALNSCKHFILREKNLQNPVVLPVDYV